VQTSLNRDISRAKDKLKILLEQEAAARWMGKIPNTADVKEINEWYTYSDVTKEMRDRSYCRDLHYFAMMKRQPANLNKSLTIIGLLSHDARVYFAFKHGKLVNWMHIQNARHRGAMCDITSNLKANLYTKPLETWLSMIGANKEVM